jgi:hypothetical protein
MNMRNKGTRNADTGEDKGPTGKQSPDKRAPGAPPTGPVQAPGRPDPRGGIDREVGDLDDPDAEDDGALPGRVGGGLAGG